MIHKKYLKRLICIIYVEHIQQKIKATTNVLATATIPIAPLPYNLKGNF